MNQGVVRVIDRPLCGDVKHYVKGNYGNEKNDHPNIFLHQYSTTGKNLEKCVTSRPLIGVSFVSPDCSVATPLGASSLLASAPLRSASLGTACRGRLRSPVVASPHLATTSSGSSARDDWLPFVPIRLASSPSGKSSSLASLGLLRKPALLSLANAKSDFAKSATTWSGVASVYRSAVTGFRFRLPTLRWRFALQSRHLALPDNRLIPALSRWCIVQRLIDSKPCVM